jgi:hypothetical protein
MDITLPEPNSSTTHKGKDEPYAYDWGRHHFVIEATRDCVTVSYDFQGQMGLIDLNYYTPEHAEEVAHMILAAAERARELTK